MTTIFDGLSSTLNSVLGAPVTIIPAGAAPSYVLHAIFRLEPFEDLREDGSALMRHLPTLSVPRDRLGDLAKGDRVQTGSGLIYELGAQQINGSPASDAFVTFNLREVS